MTITCWLTISSQRNPDVYKRQGITLTRDGMEFLSYARQVVEQTQLLEERYKNPVAHRELFSVSSQHYAFVVNAFVSLLKKSDMEKYELFLRETRTWEIIDDVKNFRSEVGVCLLYTSFAGFHCEEIPRTVVLCLHLPADFSPCGYALKRELLYNP